MFTEKQRGTFKYTIAHVLAYNMVALNLGVWRPKYLFHDWEKPWMMLFAKHILHKSSPYEWVRNWHRTHRKHHIQYYRAATMFRSGRYPNPVEIILDWEASQYTKLASPQDAYTYYIEHKEDIPKVLQVELINTIQVLGLWGTSEK